MDEEEPCGYSANFIEEVPDYLKCAICMHILKSPVMLVDCGHKFCSGCFERVKKHAKNSRFQCPIDRSSVDKKKVFDDKATTRTVLDLKVKCDRFSDGCLWSGELRHLEKHLSSDCTAGEKLRNSELLKQLEERILQCEKSLHDKDLAISMARVHNEVSISNMQEKFDKSLEEMRCLIRCLQYQFEETQKQLLDTKLELATLKDQHHKSHRKVTQIHQIVKTLPVTKQLFGKNISDDDIPADKVNTSMVTNLQSMANTVHSDKFMINQIIGEPVATHHDESSPFTKDCIALLNKEANAASSGTSMAFEPFSLDSTLYAYPHDELMLPTFDSSNQMTTDFHNIFGTQGVNSSIEVMETSDMFMKDIEDLNANLQNCQSQNTNNNITHINSQIKTMQEQITTITQLLSKKKTVFQWTLLEYASHKEMGDAVFSPTFRSSIEGRYCRLWIRWSNNDSNLDLSFELVDVTKEDLKLNPFRRDVKLEVVGKFGLRTCKTIPFSSFSNGTGYNFKSFLDAPQLDNFVINDSLYVTCILTPA